MIRRLCGYDLNGWRDLHARNWRLAPDGEEIPERHAGAALLLPDVIRADLDHDGWIGGEQAAMAPHGRGPGWGAVGAAERRRPVRDLLGTDAPPEAPELLAAAMRGMARGARIAVAAIDDLPDAEETVQENLLDALAQVRAPRRLLVWRPVLSALHWIEEHEVEDGAEIGVINHCAAGFAVQRLRIRREAGRDRDVVAPERRQGGMLIEGASGYVGLLDATTAAVAAAMPGDWRLDPRLTRAPGRLALGLPAPAEVVRLDNGRWDVLQAITPPPPPPLVLPAEALSLLSGCTTVLVETLTEGPVRAALLDGIAQSLGRAPQDTPREGPALGALAAAERLERREPVYFDFLPRISTIVFDNREARNYDLIDADETLPAGEIYRSPRPARLSIPAGRAQIAVYLRKDREARPREAILTLPRPMPTDIPVTLTIEQTPASGRARIMLETETDHRRHDLDWDGATALSDEAIEEKAEGRVAAEILNAIDDPWPRLIAALQPARPIVPNRLVLPCAADLWAEGYRRNNLAQLLHLATISSRPDWKTLANAISSPQAGVYCISSDGEIPHGIDAATVAALEHCTDQAMRDAFDRSVRDRRDALKFLTWQFRRCPEALVEPLLALWRNPNAGALPSPPPARVLQYQAVGRIVRSPALELEALGILLDRPFNDWLVRDETACMAFILSRSETAAARLSRDDLERLSGHAVRSLDHCRAERLRYMMYPIRLIGGLLRWREVEPFALVVGDDPCAAHLDQALERALEALMAAPGPFSERAREACELLRKALKGQGRPDILASLN